MIFATSQEGAPGAARRGPVEHWNAAALSRDLGGRPRAVCIDGREIVLFRDEEGRPGALDDVCPHRRMRLSQGCVVDGKLRCAYHGWTFDRRGRGESPGTPKLHSRSACYDVREVYGVLFVKPADCAATFPQFDVEGYQHLCSLEAVAEAPLEVALDNFTEIEHTPMVHERFGYVLERMAEVTTRVDSTPTSVHVVNRGPHKPMPWWLRLPLGVGRETVFTDEWTTYFSPVHAVIDHSWVDGVTGKPARVALRYYLFFTPAADDRTLIETIVFGKTALPGPRQGANLYGPLIARFARGEVDGDCAILAKLADKRPELRGMKLSRFDQPLGLHRERIDRIYRGRVEAPDEGAIVDRRREPTT